MHLLGVPAIRAASLEVTTGALFLQLKPGMGLEALQAESATRQMMQAAGEVRGTASSRQLSAVYAKFSVHQMRNRQCLLACTVYVRSISTQLSKHWREATG